jgi:uncharacterized protein GlcG (DUF336 family)
MNMKRFLASLVAFASTLVPQAQVQAAKLDCPVSNDTLKAQLVSADHANQTGFKNHFWGVVVNREGVVCAVVFSGANTGSQWLVSRQIAAAKAFTANGLSLDFGGTGTGAISTAQLYQFVQPSNANVALPLYGLAGGNVLSSDLAYNGDYGKFGTDKDPMIGQRIGGTITFGGGLALYSGMGVVGGIGVSGDTACADHSVAWQTRINLGLQPPMPLDKLTFATDPAMTNGHPHCPNDGGTLGVN